ncbi:MAG: GntR family transcriptional regulator, arabinose operon transcriptional repressor [Candidatus Sumerlaeota bacterium]|nr:GntR family transcriptional regulator, arabinose operon transcriptional repressor [Candidatus Sumerlaeota bacterium]
MAAPPANSEDKRHLSLFGHPILGPGRGLTLTSQVREILLEEIFSGRWRVGERLPSVAQMAKQTGLSRWPIQEAFELLAQEGYLNKSERSGTFLHSLEPGGRKPKGVIGVAMLLTEDQGSWSTSPYSEYRLARVMAIAESRQLSIEVKYIAADEDWENVDLEGHFFRPSVIGVMSLYSFHHIAQRELPPNRLPFVHLGGHTGYCSPTVAGDTFSGFYHLTKLVIERGHRNIVCVCDPSDSESERQSNLLGHAMAMREAGLEVNEAAWKRSQEIREGDLVGIRRFLEEFSDATAIICMWGSAAPALVEMANVIGLRVPEDLSITAHGASPLGSRRDIMMTCLEYDMDGLINEALDLLEEQRQTRRVERTCILGNPIIREEGSLAPPPEKLAHKGIKK